MGVFSEPNVNVKTYNCYNFRKIKAEQGSSLIEILLAITILVIIGIAVAFSLSTSSKILLHTDENQRARNFAEYEMESLVYPVSNSAQTGTGSYAGFTATISATTVNTNEQNVSITVTGNNIPSYTLTDYKVQ